jgi:AcrR family transcriptional regulator
VRDAIWDAAIDLFAHQGFDETTVEEIAEAAGVSRRSFFRYFSSKSDLMAEGIVNYAATLTGAIRGCPKTHSLSEVLRDTVLQVAEQSASHPRTRRIMEIAAKYPSAREAQISRMAELHESVAAAFALRCRQAQHLMPGVLAGLTLSVLSVTFRSWFAQGQQDISATARQVLATLNGLVCGDTGSAAKRSKRYGR